MHGHSLYDVTWRVTPARCRKACAHTCMGDAAVNDALRHITWKGILPCSIATTIAEPPVEPLHMGLRGHVPQQVDMLRQPRYHSYYELRLPCPISGLGHVCFRANRPRTRTSPVSTTALVEVVREAHTFRYRLLRSSRLCARHIPQSFDLWCQWMCMSWCQQPSRGKRAAIDPW